MGKRRQGEAEREGNALLGRLGEGLPQACACQQQLSRPKSNLSPSPSPNLPACRSATNSPLPTHLLEWTGMSSIAPALALLTAADRGAELRWQVSTPSTPRK
jgi:hypothetical protein